MRFHSDQLRPVDLAIIATIASILLFFALYNPQVKTHKIDSADIIVEARCVGNMLFAYNDKREMWQFTNERGSRVPC
mgnify:FL=1